MSTGAVWAGNTNLGAVRFAQSASVGFPTEASMVVCTPTVLPKVLASQVEKQAG